MEENSKPMDPERYERIKRAWMDRYGATEDQWENFQPQTKPLYSEKTVNSSAPSYEFDPAQFDSYAVEAHKLEWPLCPNERELALRLRSKSTCSLSLARKAHRDGAPAVAKKHFEDALVYREQAKYWAAKHNSIRSKI